uniref:Uncharacterized protein n=2 Tax=Ditylum brightwellii TaxID=49249 RepID=A0A7S4W9G6_9STRA|mmetsp:Transcript_25004/g.33149  ORF Transcript_25004/g.33149 Transcript_25004/m.33149 type:complete len:385 (-) Transcript_25004:314-1468(-)
MAEVMALMSIGWQLYSSYKTARKVGRIASNLSQGKMPKATDLAGVLFGAFGVDLDMIPDNTFTDGPFPGGHRKHSTEVGQNNLEDTGEFDLRCNNEIAQHIHKEATAEAIGEFDSRCDVEVEDTLRDDAEPTLDFTRGEIEIARSILEEAMQWLFNRSFGGNELNENLSYKCKSNEMCAEMSFEDLIYSVFKATNQWECHCLTLKEEYDALLAAEVPSDEDAQISHVQQISLVTNKLEAAQMNLADLKSRLSIVASNSFFVLGGSIENGFYAGRNIRDWENKCKVLKRQYNALRKKEVQLDETCQVRHIEELTVVTYRLEAAEVNLAELKSRLHEAYNSLQEQYIEILGKEVPDDEDAQVLHCQHLSLIMQRLDILQLHLHHNQ